MGSVLNFIIQDENSYGNWSFQGPIIQKVMNEYSYTIFPEVKKDCKNYLLIEPTESYFGLVKRIDAILMPVISRYPFFYHYLLYFILKILSFLSF